MARKSEAKRTVEASVMGHLLQLIVTFTTMIAKKGGDAGRIILWLGSKEGEPVLDEVVSIIVIKADEAYRATIRAPQILPTKHVIDCDADPFLPNGWKMEEHTKGGQWEWNTDQVELYLAGGQKDGGYVNGHKLRKQLKDKPILNANVLDYLLAHQELIPEEWKGKRVYFWGTVYRYSDGHLCVRCLGWHGRTWGWSSLWLGNDWFGGRPAAFRK